MLNMKTFHTNEEWFDRLLPEGLLIPSSTLLSGPGGSGKPLIGNVIVAAWLRQGGIVVFMSLQYPDHSFIAAGLKSITKLDLDDYKDRIAFIELDVSLNSMIVLANNRIKANVAKPEVWDTALEHACSIVPDEGPGILIFGTALNLLLFSPTYGKEILEKIKSTMRQNLKYTLLFSTSTSAKKEEVKKLENLADNLVITRSDPVTHKLYLQISRIKNVPLINDEIEVLFSPEIIIDIKEIADRSRKRIIPLISKL
jgi:KaiC/GvpD/RAD55 family RecA-like ATPase